MHATVTMGWPTDVLCVKLSASLALHPHDVIPLPSCDCSLGQDPDDVLLNVPFHLWW